MACTGDLIHSVFGAAKELGVPFECHMSEYASEVLSFIEMYGERPFDYLDRHGLIPERFVAAYCVSLSDSEFGVVRDHDIRVVHCPFSNCGKGVPETPRLLHQGTHVAFGSDGAGHAGLDLFREMRAFRCVMSVTHGLSTANPQIMPAAQLLSMATKGGAAALFADDLGTIEQGNLADIIAVDLDQPHLMATGSIVHSLIEGANGADVRHSIINGKVVMRDRELLTIDWERVSADAHALMGRHKFFAKQGAWCG